MRDANCGNVVMAGNANGVRRMETEHLPRFSLLSCEILDTSTAELMQLYRMHSNQTTSPMMLVVSKVTLVVWVGGAAVVVALPNPSIMPNMPGLHSFSVDSKQPNEIYISGSGFIFLPGLLATADQVRYTVYKVTRELCSRPEWGKRSCTAGRIEMTLIARQNMRLMEMKNLLMPQPVLYKYKNNANYKVNKP